MTIQEPLPRQQTSWAAIVPLEDGGGYRILACYPRSGKGQPPRFESTTGSSPGRAYDCLVRETGQSWPVAVREADCLGLDPIHWSTMVRGIPKIKIVSEYLWEWAEPIWEEAWRDAPGSLEISRALWLAITAAQEDRGTFADDQQLPF